MSEQLFTPEEIRAILLEAEDPKYLDPFLMHQGVNKTSIFRISRQSGLILPYGNEHTGYHHINCRHSPVYKRDSWHNDGRLDDPSVFSLDVAPIQYVQLAAKIFKPENKNLDKNKKPELFDLYVGNYGEHAGKKVEYFLLTYKGTGVIHTFYISKNRPFNKKKVFNLVQGPVSGSQNMMTGGETLKIPYLDSSDKELFQIIVRYSKILQTEKWYIQVNSTNAVPLLTTFIEERSWIDKTPLAFKTVQGRMSDLSWIEKLMKRMLDNKYEF